MRAENELGGGSTAASANDQLEFRRPFTPYPEWLRQLELSRIDNRRTKAKHAPDAPLLGLALSGGGIRSATLSLGFLQALARTGMLRRVDYLSTVSGGGYVGCFIGALYARSKSPAEVERALNSFPESSAVGWLRANGRYLAPGGAGASWLAGAVLIRNWLTLLVVLSLPLSCVMFLLRGLAGWLSTQFETASPSLMRATEPAPSCLFCIPIALAITWAVPCGVAYWLVRTGLIGSISKALHIVTIAILTVLCLSGWVYYQRDRQTDWPSWIIAQDATRTPAMPWHLSGPLAVLVGSLTLVIYFLAARGRFYSDLDNVSRNKLSEWLKGGLVATLVSAVLALWFWASAHVQAVTSEGGWRHAWTIGAGFFTAATPVVLWTHRLLAKFSAQPGSPRRPLPVQPIAMLAASTVLALLAMIVANLTYVWAPAPKQWLTGFLVMLVAAAVASRFPVFVNQSSLSAVYAARLTRTYLGASNPLRFDATRRVGKQSVTEPISEDQLSFSDYEPDVNGGPIHLLNVTLNETVDPRVQVQQPDRKGMNMAVGPDGVSLAVRHHATWSGEFTAPPSSANEFCVFNGADGLSEAEQLSVGTWMAISGAAVSTGLGSRTSGGASLLLGLLNIRLGYWWNSGTDPRRRPGQARAAGPSAALMSLFGRLSPVYRLLFAELSARFPGTAIPQWNLSDGGHSDNTGCYELIRRRVPFIICCDNGEDQSGQHADLANLVRIARVDFGAEIEFLTRAELEELLHPSLLPYFAPPAALTAAERPHGDSRGAYATLARVRYAAAPSESSFLLIAKPAVRGNETLDVVQYQSANSGFPNQSTADQSFDDAQWEAHRKLGESIGIQLFSSFPRVDGKWHPALIGAEASPSAPLRA